MPRVHHSVLIASIVLLSWLSMQAVHELGHVLGAWCSGGAVAKVVLHPLTISRTDLADNPHPLVTVWAGPLVGVLLPLALWVFAVAMCWPAAYLLRFFAGFCLVANGAYVGAGSLDRVGDCGEMLRHGSPIWSLWLFGLTSLAGGLWLWHRQGPHFGLGEAGGRVSIKTAYGLLAALMLMVALELVLGGE